MHNLNECYELLQKSLASRDLVKKKRLSYSFLGTDHLSRFCKATQTCAKCKRKHQPHLMMITLKTISTRLTNPQVHQNKEKEKRASAQTTICNITEAGDLPLAWEKYQYGFITTIIHNNGSGGTFVSEECMNELNVEAARRNYRCMEPKKSEPKLLKGW